VFVPDTHTRYSNLVGWSTTADARKYRFGKSSDGRPGIYIAWDVWDSGQALTGRSVGDLAKSVVKDARNERSEREAAA
jgi:hypothetical protein